MKLFNMHENKYIHIVNHIKSLRISWSRKISTLSICPHWFIKDTFLKMARNLMTFRPLEFDRVTNLHLRRL